ncbi:MAG: D-inositol-3-phosphate glycosyltransferase [Phycisphaerae bacterium]|nr:D-inositol-3-phosphate glycosyltransferase [Phycisphaerae bacterium]
MIRIALDARTLFSTRRRGTGKNLLDLYRELARQRPDWEFLLFHHQQPAEPLFAEQPNVQPRYIDLPGTRWNLWEELRLPLAAKLAGVRVLHCPANSVPRFPLVPLVSTIHDLIPLKVIDPDQPAEAARFRTRVLRCVRVARRIIAVSSATKQDLISDLGADGEKIDVLTWAADAACQPVRDEALLAAIRSRYMINGRYGLVFSGRSRRKNTAGILRGWAQVPESIRRDVQLLLIGVEPAEQRQQLEQLTENLGIAAQCRVQGFAPEEDIPALLSGAELLAFCSLYEGFGLPILDAFCCETPVLTSSLSSMPEVAGDAAEYCDPHQPASIAAGMMRLLTEPARRAELVKLGRERIKRYTWQRSAETVGRVFERCL